MKPEESASQVVLGFCPIYEYPRVSILRYGCYCQTSNNGGIIKYYIKHHNTWKCWCVFYDTNNIEYNNRGTLPSLETKYSMC